MKYRIKVEVLPLPQLLDPQGQAIAQGLRKIGMEGLHSVRAGKTFLLELEAESLEKAREKAHQAAQKLLHNPLIETFSLTVDPYL
ncbi:MAG: phosphoribosylformylglycinamidine synthase subunit PurS [Bacteroidia bacterium]